MDAHCIRCGKVMGDSWVESCARAMTGLELPLCSECIEVAEDGGKLAFVDRRISELRLASE